MVSANQIERLKKDSRELGNCIRNLNKRGKIDASYKMAKKRNFLIGAIEQVENRTRG
jgi:hypothetical protein